MDGSYDQDGPIAQIEIILSQPLSAGQIAHCVEEARKLSLEHARFCIDRRYLNGDVALFGVVGSLPAESLRVTTSVERMGIPFFMIGEAFVYSRVTIESCSWFPADSAQAQQFGLVNDAVCSVVRRFAAGFEWFATGRRDVPDNQELLSFPIPADVQR